MPSWQPLLDVRQEQSQALRRGFQSICSNENALSCNKPNSQGTSELCFLCFSFEQYEAGHQSPMASCLERLIPCCPFSSRVGRSPCFSGKTTRLSLGMSDAIGLHALTGRNNSPQHPGLVTCLVPES